MESDFEADFRPDWSQGLSPKWSWFFSRELVGNTIHFRAGIQSGIENGFGPDFSLIWSLILSKNLVKIRVRF